MKIIIKENKVVVEYVKDEEQGKLTSEMLHKKLSLEECEKKLQQIKNKHEYHHSHPIITIQDKDLGALLTINCQPKMEMSVKLFPFEFVSVCQLSQGDINIKTRLKRNEMEMRKKFGAF